MKYILKGYYKFKKALCSFKYLFPFFLFKDWVSENQLRIEFLIPNTGVWNQLHKTLGWFFVYFDDKFDNFFQKITKN